MPNPHPSPSTRFLPGHAPHPGVGRRKKLLARVDERLHAAGIHPVDELLKLYEQADLRDRIRIMIELLAYVQPKPKDDVPSDAELQSAELKLMTSAELLKLAKEKLATLEQEAV